MASSLTLANARARALYLLGGLATGFTNAELDQVIRRALEEYTRASLNPNSPIRPRVKVDVLTPTNGTREQSLSSLTGLMQVQRVWFPYVENSDPTWIDFELWWTDGAPVLFLTNTSGDGTSIARIFWYAPHTLNGLDSANATTFDARDENLILTGAAGYLCAQRATGPNAKAYLMLAAQFGEEFQNGLTPARKVSSQRVRNASADLAYWDPNTLDWR